MKKCQALTKEKLLVGAVTIYLVWIFIFAFYNYHHEKENLYRNLDQQLISSARIPSIVLPANFHHANMTKQILSEQQDLANINQLSRYTDHSDIVYIYTLIKKNQDLLFTSSSATAEERQSGKGLSLFLSHYDDADPRVYEAFSSSEPIFIEYADNWGNFRSVFLPQVSSDGSVYLAAADISIDHIKSLLRENLYHTLLVSILFLVFSYPLFRAFNYKLMKKSKYLEQELDLKNEDMVNHFERLKHALESSKQAWFDLDLTTQNMSVSDKFIKKMGYVDSAFISDIEAWKSTLHPEDKQRVINEIEQCILENTLLEIDYRQKKSDGNYVWLQSIGCIVEWDKDNQPKRLTGTHTDISERKQSEIVLRTLAEHDSGQSGDILQKVVTILAQSHNMKFAFIGERDKVEENLINTLAVWDRDHIADNFSYTREGTPCSNVLDNSPCFYNDVQTLFPDDEMLVEIDAVSYLGVPLTNKQGECIGLISVLNDQVMQENSKAEVLLRSLAVRVASELERRQADEILRLSAQVFKSAHEGIIIINTHGEMIDVNPKFCDITGYSQQEIIGKHIDVLYSNKHPETFYRQMWNDVINDGYWQGEVWYAKKNGRSYPQLLTFSAIENEFKQVTHYIGLSSDITEIKRQQRSLELMAHYDILTGLPNRSLFTELFRQSVENSRVHNTKLAICLLDLDDFKEINEQYGHAVGDKLLINVGQSLTQALREDDTVCRMGGDEFTLILCNIESEQHCRETLMSVFARLALPYNIDEHTINMTVSCGVTLYPDDDSDLDTLVRHADQAMYQAKLVGRNQFMLFDSSDQLQMSKKHEQLNVIQQGLDNGEFELYFQPKVSMRQAGKVFGMEGLVRWLHPKKGLLYPDSFLPIIDGTDLELKLGQWVVSKALRQLSVWAEQKLELELSINIFANYLQSAGFMAELEALLLAYPTISSQYLQLEILESSALGDLATVNNIIQECKDKLGVTVALDDFGTGYSSLTHLRHLPAEIIKIDRSFVNDILDDPNDYAIVEGIIGLTTAFNRKLIAEGVETTEHGLMLLAMGCYKFQGYGIAEAMPEHKVLDWLGNYVPNQAWISYSQQNYTQKQHYINQFTLAANSWVNLLEKAVNQPVSENNYQWPILDNKKCHHALWLKRARLEKIFEPNQFVQLDLLHIELHDLASQLLEFYKNNDNEAQNGVIEKIKSTHKQFIAVLNIDV